MQATLTTKPQERKKSETRANTAPESTPSLQNRLGASAGTPLFLQPKLSVSRPDDPYEQEADAIADKVMRMPDPAIQRKCSSCETSGSSCPKCAGEKEKLKVQSKLAVNQPGDRYEQEADLIADQILPIGSAQTVQRKCASCSSQAVSAEKSDELPITPNLSNQKVSRKEAESNGSNGSQATGEPKTLTAEALSGSGSPLPQSVREVFEPRMGRDFSGVRVHTDGNAAESARSINALAFTSGENIYFGAGQFAPHSSSGQRLLAHELTHTIQQTGGRQRTADATSHESPGGAAGAVSSPGHTISRAPDTEVQRWPSADDVLGTLGDAVSTAGDVVDAAGEAVSETINDAGEALTEAGEAIVETAENVGETIVETGEAVAEAAGEAVDWLATEAGQAAQSLAAAFGVDVSITEEGLVINVPEFCPIDAIPYDFDLDSIDEELMAPVFAIPLGPLALIGEVGLVGHLQPQASIQLGPICIRGVRILINPLTGTYSISGSVSATVAASLGAEVRGGLRGALKLEGVILIGGVPVPIEVPLVGVEGGLAGLIRGIGAATLTIRRGLSISGGTVSMTESDSLDVGLAGDLFLGAYAQLDIEGENVCRIYWQPYEWHGDIAGSLGISMGLTVTPGGSPSVVPSVSPPTFTSIPFDQIPLALSREGFADDCPIKDRICEILQALNLLPSQNGGTWDWGGPYGPGARLPGPLDVYQRNPGIPSGSTCRGACGPNCDTCEAKPTYTYRDPATGDVWRYTNFQDCNSNGGCREHDAAFDWAADRHGETGRFAIIMPWHMAANIECTCNNLTGNCIAWIAGLPPYDSKMYFADTVVGYPSGTAAPSSTAVPSIDETTHSLAESAIASGDCATALQAVLSTLIARGQINASLANWSYVARSDRGEGVTNFTWVEDPVTHERRARAPVTVQIFTPACKDVGWLFSTVMHEYVHVLQVLAGAPASEFGPTGAQRPEFVARDEVEAYLWEIEHALGSGLINNPGQMQDVGRRLTTHFNRMTPALQAIYQVRYDAAQRRVLAAVAHRPGMSIEEARRIVQESSREIAELLRLRPGNEAVIDRRIEEIRRRRAEAMVEVALVDNPVIQVVRPGDPGTYRVPTLDGEGRVRYLHGGIQVAWHMAATSPSAYSLGEGIGAGGDMAIAGTAIQGRVHPFPPDIDFDEHIHVVADTKREAGMLAAGRIIASIRRVSGGPVPGRTDIEFRHLLTFPSRGRGIKMSLGEVLGGSAVARLGAAIAALNGGNINTFWRGMLADGRFTNVTRVIFISANRRDGRPLITAGGSADFNLAFLDDPGEIPSTNLAQFAWEMCCEAVRRADAGKWLKAGKRAYNYFSTTGDMEHMRALEPVFIRPETEVEQYATVIDGISRALVTTDMGVRQARTRILTVDEARRQVEEVARTVETILPDSGSSPSPAAIATELRNLAGELRPRNARGQLAQSDILAGQFETQADAIRKHIDTGVRAQVQPIIDGFVRPVCPDRNACRRRRR